MTATTLAPPLPRESGIVHGWRAAYAVEWRKLLRQWTARLLAIVAVVGPLAYAVLLKAQSGNPTDALLGVWAHTSGYSVALVLLVFAGSWGFPIVAGLVAGDMFASEDRLGTWKTLLTRSCSRRDVFVGKVLAATTLAVAVVVLFAASSIISAVALIGSHDLVGLSGNVVSPHRAVLLVGAAWLWSILPVLAFVSLALLFSVATRSSIAGVLGPVLVALVMQLLNLVGAGRWVHLLLVASAFDGWHSFAGVHVYYVALLTASLVCLAWIGVCLAVAWWLLRRREFAGSTARTPGLRQLVIGVAITAVVISVLALGTAWGPTGVTSSRLESSITSTFGRLTAYQQRLLGRDVLFGSDLTVVASCKRPGQSSRGPGDNWNCALDVYTLAAQGGLQQFPVTYEVSVKSDGCYRAENPPTFVGGRTVTTPSGHAVINPLFVFYGCFNTL
jgi:ABC-2 type transport system permease protein